LGKDAAYLLDSSKARSVLDWDDTVSLEKGIEETVAWVKDNLKVLEKQNPDYVHKP
jgi:dTDP-glucose 4,6-dehydratase